jgi:hypothetical protein
MTLGRRKLLLGSLVGVVLALLVISSAFLASKLTSVSAIAMPGNLSTSCEYNSCYDCESSACVRESSSCVREFCFC